MKKLLALILALATVLSFSGCGKKTEPEKKSDKEAETQQTPQEESDTAALLEAKELIEKGQYQQAYDLLYAIEKPTEKEEQLLRCFRFRPLEKKTNDSTTVYTYTEDGYLLKMEYSNETRLDTYTYTYDSKMRVVSLAFERITDDEIKKKPPLMVFGLSYSDLGQYGPLAPKGPDENFTCTYDDANNGYTMVCGENTYTYTFNANGDLLTYCENGEEIRSNTYDKQGNILTRIENGKVIGSYTYHSNNQLATCINKSGGSEYSSTYDKQGNMLTYKSTDSDGSWSENIYTYNSQGNMLTRKWKKSDGSWSETIYNYDSQGKQTFRFSKESDGTVGQREYTYDDNGNLLKQHYTDSSGNYETYEYTYDDHGNITSSRCETNQNIMTTADYTCSYTYDEQGNMLTKTQVDEDGWQDIYIYGNVDDILPTIKLDNVGRIYDKSGNELIYQYTDSEGVLQTSTTTWQLFYNPRFGE